MNNKKGFYIEGQKAHVARKRHFLLSKKSLLECLTTSYKKLNN